MADMCTSRRRPAVLAGVIAILVILSLLLLSPLDAAASWRPRAPKVKTVPSIVDLGDSRSITPPVWNRPPEQHVPEATPLFIGFTRNWALLEQAVVSYIAAGWPPADIYVVENTGVMDANVLGQLSPDNPFYLDHGRLTRAMGINVLTAPTYLSFAQLQNFFLYTAITRHWPHYFWSHMDVVASTDEGHHPFASLYQLAVDALREATADPRWAMRFFAYDHLTLSNAAAYRAVGGFDTFIPYYQTDCDFHFRVGQARYTVVDVHAGHVYDVGDALPDLGLLFRGNTTDAAATCTLEDINAARNAAVTDVAADSHAYGRADCRFAALRRMLADLDRKKHTHEGGRNYWQTAQTGGQGDPFWLYPPGFEKALEMHIEHGKQVFEKKWSHPGCDLAKAGNTCRDSVSCSAWRRGESAHV